MYFFHADMIEERLALMKNVYPQLREYCREKHGLELQVSWTDNFFLKKN